MFMQNFVIRNSSHLEDTTEIDIFGDIGEGWWDDDSTSFQEVKAKLETIDTSNIKLNISSFGGDVNHAFSIYNLLKTNPATVEANIMGFTASAGTIVALAADSVKMDENTMFLVHNAWTIGIGNQHDLRQTADDLEKIDNRLISIYKSKTGKRKDTIHNLMKEEKWLSASEAKDFGFVDTTYAPIKAAASYNKDIAKINLTKGIPKINIKSNNMDIKVEFEKFKTEIMEFFKANKEKENPEEITEELISAKVIEILSQKSTEIETHITTISGDLETEKEQNNTHTAKIVALEKEITDLKMKGTDPKNSGDPDPKPGHKKERTEGEKVLLNILNNATPLEKANASYNPKKD